MTSETPSERSSDEHYHHRHQRSASAPHIGKQRVMSAVSNDASDAASITQAPRLSRISCSAKNALTLNQLQRVEIPASYARAEDGARLYVLDVFLKPSQTGIPSVRMSAEFFDEHFPSNRDTSTATAAAATSGNTTSVLPQPTALTQTESMTTAITERQSSKADVSSTTSKQKSASPKQPQYRIEYRYSAFRELRERLRDAVERNDRHHLKWCWYCSRIQWLATFGSFPSRHPLLRMLADRWRCGKSVERVLLDKVLRRRQRLALFVNDVVSSAKDASYRYQSAQCDCFERVSTIVTDFLAEPQQPPPRTSSGGYGW